MFLQDGISRVIIIIIIICLLENIVSVPWSHYGARFEFIRYNSASILWIDFSNPVSQKRCPCGSPPYMNRTFCAWRYLAIQRKKIKLGQAFTE
jgi:hypothetical protein